VATRQDELHELMYTGRCRSDPPTPRRSRCPAASRLVDPTSARAVADSFLASRSVPGHPLVRAAYRQLAEQAGWWFARLTGDGCARPVRVCFTACAQPYDTATELSTAVRLHRTLELRSSRYDVDRPHPALDTSVGGDYDRFRAVHDIVSHGWLQHGFDRDGEFRAWRIEHAMYTGLARRALATELHAEHSVLWTSGDLADHKAVLLEARLLNRSRRGIHSGGATPSAM
jgi:hypothetical protein